MTQGFDAALESFEPDEAPDRSDPSVVEAFEKLPAAAVVHVWGGDWCGDCRAQLPVLARALAAADVAAERVQVHPVDGEKSGELVDAYGVTWVPTVVVEHDGSELARYVESAADPIDVAVASQLRTAGEP